jgi:predicted ester cyclase
VNQQQQSRDELERLKAVALRFKKSQGTKDMPAVEREVLAPDYNRMRGGSFHFAANARDQDWPHPGMYLRTSFPDRVDRIERTIAEGDRTGLLFRINATHTGNYFGVEPTGRRLEVYEIAFLRIVNGQMVEGWFMMDEVEVLKQLGARLPRRRDGTLAAPALPQAGEPPGAIAQRLTEKPNDTREQRNKLAVLQALARGDLAALPGLDRRPLHHLHAYARSRGTTELRATGLPDRVEVVIAESDQVWVRGNFTCPVQGNVYGLSANGERVGVPSVVIADFEGDRWTRTWCFTDELGIVLQLGKPDLLL